MNTLRILSIAIVSTTFLFSCKNEKKPSSEIVLETEKNLAIKETNLDEITTSDNYLYVTSNSGLSLREYANLQSEKLAIMPFGTRVKIISSEKNPTMKVGEIKGGMDQIEFNHKKGFAFNGYLSKYFPPEKGISTKGYAEELNEIFPNVIFNETIGGTASKPTNTEDITLPDAQWHEAFYIAQQLYNYPKEFLFPSSKGKQTQIIKEKKYQKNTSTTLSTSRWTSELQITRKEGALEKIEYVYQNKGFSKIVTISKIASGMKISKTEIVE